MKKIAFALMTLTGFLLTSCDSDDDDLPEETNLETPLSYIFTRNGASTVDFSGQTTRIKMGEELATGLKDETTTEAALLAMFAHQEGENTFMDTELNASDKNIRSKTAASNDFFFTNTADQALIRADFEGWIAAQVDEVFPSWNVAAAAGTAGQIADGSATRYINAKGLEYDQLVVKGLIGALMVDQALNNYLSTSILDEGTNRADNDAGILVDGKTYTNMEHKWDEAYGYVYGLNADSANPNDDLGADSFLNKYIGRVEGDEDFAGIADAIFQAFKLGRAAIVAGDYTIRDEQAEVIRELISELIGIRAVYYLQQGKLSLDRPNPEFGTAFHDFSEGYGFIYSLQFTRRPGTDEPYFTKTEVDAILTDLMDDGPNGLWDVQLGTLDTLSETIAERFNFTVEQAGN